MNDQKFETESSCSGYAKSESMSGTEDSVSSLQENNGRLEWKKKLKKVRSIRVLRFSSIRSSTEKEKSQYDNLSMSDASPNYMKATTSSHAKESFQSSQRLFTRKTLTRMSTVKLSRSLTKKLSGGTTDLKRKLKPSRSSDYAGNKSQKVITRRLSLKPVRILTRISTSNSNKSSMEKKGPQMCQSPDSSLHKATRSSTLKDSHFPDRINPQEGSGSQELSTMRICSYTYCSIHGRHHHEDLPPLKRFVSMRRRLLKNQKSMKMETGPVSRSKQYGITRKATQKSQDPGNKTAHSVRSHSQKGKKLTRDSNDRHHDKQASTVQEKDDKYIKMWHLIYKHPVLSNAVKGENKLPFDGKDKEEGVQDDLPSNGVNSSCQDYCESETDQDMDDANKNVVEMVQKAFDEILLPETEDFSADDHFKARCIDSDEEHLEKSESPKEETWLKVDKFRNLDEELTAKKLGAKPDQNTPKRWTNMKKLILLKRFVKALEKVRNFNLHRYRNLPSDAYLGAENVNLRLLTAEEKKNAEEWMLDYALQKVISKLEPAQKRRVSLLVEAFETILPFQDAENVTRSFATVETQPSPARSLDDSIDHTKEETDKENVYSNKILLQKASSSDNSIVKYADNVGHNPTLEHHNPIVLTERCLPQTETMKNIPASGAIDEDLNGKQSLARSCDNDEKSTKIKDFSADVIMCSSREEAPSNEIVNEVPQNLISNLNAEVLNSKSESPGGDFETKNLVGVNGEQFSMSKDLILKGIMRSLGSNLVSSEDPSSDLLDESTATRKERIAKAKLETETLAGFPIHEESEAPKSAVVEPETQLENQNYKGLWYLIYKHMVSGTEANDSNHGAGEKELEYDGSKSRGNSVSYESVPVMNKDMHFKDHGVADPEIELDQIEAIKMVEEAIDAIVPDVEDHLPDGKSLTNNTISDKEERVASINEETEEQEEKPEPNEGNKPKQNLPRGWSNLKKVILLRRFIKSLEKVRMFNPRGPRYLPMEPDSESEKVRLRHQEMAERKGTEEWMLDHALRQVVATLTPARKRKVALLVEAFETVIPTIKN